MNIVALYGLKDDREKMSGILADALGVTKVETLSRLRIPGSGPLIVRLFADCDQADILAARLRSGGFQTVVLNDADIAALAGGRTVKKFVLGEGDLRIESTDGGNLAIAYQDIDLILRGTAISVRTETETTRKRSLSLGRAVLTGGLVMTKTTKTVHDVTTGEREGFLTLFSSNTPVLFFRDSILAYESLGPSMKPFRSANFSYLTAELRRRCTGATYDERLVNRSGQAALLGPTLSPEKHLNVAIALLAKVLRGKSARS
jgi:hypothetical protein